MHTIRPSDTSKPEWKECQTGIMPVSRRRSVMPHLSILAMFFLIPAISCAHDLWINISSHFPQPGDSVKAYLGWGHHYPFSDFLSPKRVESMALLRPDGTLIPIVPGKKEPGIPIHIEHEGVYIVGAAIRPGYYTKTSHGHGFKSKKESKDVISSTWYEKYAKAVICAGNGSEGPYGKAFGHAIEIIPLDNPCKMRPGGDLRVKVLRSGRPLKGAFIYKSRLGQPSDKALSCPERTDKNGVAKIHLAQEGIWRLMVKQKEPPLDPALCDNRAYTAFLTFAVRE